MLVALEMSLAAECDRCLAMSPVDGLRERSTCCTCDSPIDVAAALADAFPGGARYLFDDHDPVLEALVQGIGHELQRSSERARARVVLSSVAFSCRACAAPQALPVAGNAEVACACGETAPIRWPDASTRGWDLRLLCVVGETPPRPATRHVSGLVIPCGGCGAPLSGLATGRTVTCEHCGAANLVPDTAWANVPGRAHRPFTLLYNIDEPALARLVEHIDPDAARWKHEPAKSWLAAQRARTAPLHLERVLRGEATSDLVAARQLAARELTAAEAAHVDNGLTARERKQLASGRICAALPDLWARSSEPATRAVAAHVVDPMRLADDPSPEVRVVVAKRQGLARALVQRLSTDPASAVRAAIAARHDASIEILKKLCHDGDDRVAQAAKANPSHHPGLFARLFDR